MRKILITQAKPNPAGKDRYNVDIPNSQLAGEWVDIKNTGDEDVSLKNLELQHVAYKIGYPNGVWEKVRELSDISLPVGTVVRIHTGGLTPLMNLQQVDRIGADYHVFTGKGYVWNNDRSDSPRVKNVVSGAEIDKATYTSAPEGKILKRSGNYLV